MRTIDVREVTARVHEAVQTINFDTAEPTLIRLTEILGPLER